MIKPWRAAVAFLVTPVAAGVLSTAFLLIVSQIRGNRLETRALPLLFVVMVVQAFAMLVVGGVPLWFTLRVFRKRSRGAYSVAGAVLGLAGVLIRVGLGFGAPAGAGWMADIRRPERLWEMLIMILAGVGAAQVFRAVAGVREEAASPTPAPES